MKCFKILLSLLLMSVFRYYLMAENIDGIHTISLKGIWNVRLDLENKGDEEGWAVITDGSSIILPGTLDDAGIGVPNMIQPDMSTESLVRLRRKHTYIGNAWYTKVINIPEDWEGAHVFLELERVIWKSRVFIDGQEKGSGESLVGLHLTDLGILVPGKHIIALNIDNRLQYQISGKADHPYTQFLAHAYGEETQSIWNGVLGNICLTAKKGFRISSVKVISDMEDGTVSAEVKTENFLGKSKKLRYTVTIVSSDGQVVAENRDMSIALQPGSSCFTLNIHIGNIVPWDEFCPDYYVFNLTLEGKGMRDSYKTNFAFRNIKNKGHRFYINGRPLYLRGEVDCAVFPLKGYPPMDETSWIHIMSTYKRFGLNHIRFHSWCPPEAAFSVADRMGLYLYVELPVWAFNVGKHPESATFIAKEADRILTEYGNHPSLCFISMGNELEGDFEWLGNLVTSLKQRDSRHLYTTTTYTFQKGHGLKPEPWDDFITTQYTESGWARCQGIFDYIEPNFSGNFSTALKPMDKPVIAHEIGQYSVYPDLREINKYTGNLIPVNLMSIRSDLQKKNRLSEACSYCMATGRFAYILYKGEMEYHLRTPESNGFELLGLKDFPGQGTAIVGMIDSFGEDKGIITDAEWKQSCNDVVPLCIFDKVVYSGQEKFTSSFSILNNSSQTIDAVVYWMLQDKDGNIVCSGQLAKTKYPKFTMTAGENISFKFNSDKACRYTLRVGVEGLPYRNSYNLWYYPDNKFSPENYGYSIARNSEELEMLVGKASKVLYIPASGKVHGVKTRFTPVFWSAVLFPDQPGCMGILCDPHHPALCDFPTDSHADWQWWYLLTYAKAVYIPEHLSSSILIQILDNMATNRLQSILFEFEVDGTDILVCTADLEKNPEKRLPAMQLYRSISKYVLSDEFNPKIKLTSDEFFSIINMNPVK